MKTETGFVYKIKFPDGSFYIGATINFENRIWQHRYHCTSKPLKEKIKEFKVSKKDFPSFFSVLHSGEDFKEVESRIIQKLRNSPFILNTAGVRAYWKPSGKDRRVSFKVKQVELDRLLELSGLEGIGMEGYLSKMVTEKLAAIKSHQEELMRKMRGAE